VAAGDVGERLRAKRPSVIFVRAPGRELQTYDRLDDGRIGAEGELCPFGGDFLRRRVGIPREATECVEIRHRERMREPVRIETDELLLFFHHAPYTYDLHSGKTVIQYIYDSHYEGAAEVAEFVDQWKSLQGHVDAERFNDVLARLQYQAGHAIVWRDAICNYFLKKSGIADDKGRAGHFPNRIEAESMRLEGYASVDVTPWENASGGKAVACKDAQGCNTSYKFTGAEGKYTVAILYFDQKNGESKFRVLLNGKVIDHWIANDQLPATKIGADAATRRNIANLTLHPGDEIRIEGIPDRDEPAALDYIEITPQN
jgi:alpha-glucuronidase